ncbi:MAG: acetyl-CoA decarbonylase/synthase complex subunit delta [bacterium]|nr:acetyl-CoA decarbonylase/synthase complex subunit delta [bacterium]
MPVERVKERYASKVGEVVLGATPAEGGTRSHQVKVGGDSTLPFLHAEGVVANRPVIAMEVQDVIPEWNPVFTRPVADVMGDPGAWAQKCVEAFGADLIYLRLDGANPEKGGRKPDQCAATLRQVLGAVKVPVIVVGSGVDEADDEVMPVVAEAGAGENLLLGTATQDHYKTLTAACMVHKHSIVALSPIDINICKQLNILISEMNLPLERIVIDPTVGALGYGIEYTYSIMERIRLGALSGDRMMSMPVLCTIGYEVNRAKETAAGAAEFPTWGEVGDRAVLWEAMTASCFMQAGGHIFVLRHPTSVKLLRQQIDALMAGK